MSKPIHIARVGAVRVPVLRNGEERYCVAWRAVAGGERKRETFSGKDGKRRAIARADEIACAIASSNADVLTLTSATRDDLRLSDQILSKLAEDTGQPKIPMHCAMQEYAAACKLIAPHTLHEAVTFFARGHIERLAAPTTATIVAELIAQMQDDQLSDIYITQLRRDLDKFAGVVLDLAAATEDAIRAYLRTLRTGYGPGKGQPVSARRRDNVLGAIVTLSRFARKKKYLAEDKKSPAEHIPKIAIGSDVSTFTPKILTDTLQWFTANAPQWIPLIAIGSFAGPRTSEIYRMTWEMFNWNAMSIGISKAIAWKVRKSRNAPIPGNLAAWLEPWRTATGPLFPDVKHPTRCRKRTAVESARRRVWARFKKATGIEWKKNICRHSFGANRLATVKSYDQVALEMGNSPPEVREHYNDSKTEEEAKQYNAIMPPAPLPNVVPFTAAASA